MEPAAIKSILFRIVFPIFLFFEGLLVPVACSKGNTGVTDPVNMPAPNNDTAIPVSGSKKYLALGDSYTIGTSVSESDRYPVQTAAILQAQGIDVHTDIIATNGWTTGDLLNATNDHPVAHDYDVVTLLIGVNNQYQGRSLEEYRQQFTALVQRSIALAGNRPPHVIVLSIPDYSVTPFAKGRDVAEIAAEIDAFNAVNKLVAGNYKTQYLDITEESRKAATDLTLVASDNLHFSGREYSLWSYKLVPLIKTALQ